MRWSTRLAAALLLTLGPAACTGSEQEEVPPESGVDRSEPFPDLNLNEMLALCDWTAGKLGGYGMTQDCGTFLGTHQECIDAMDEPLRGGCALTVGAWEDCVSALGGDPCRLETVEPDARCVPLVECGVRFVSSG